MSVTEPELWTKLVTPRFPLIVVESELALKVPAPPTAAKLSVPVPAFKVPSMVVAPATDIPSGPADRTDPLCSVKAPARLSALVASEAPVAEELTCRLPIRTAASIVESAPVRATVEFVFVPPKLPPMTTFPEAVIVFAAVFVTVPALVKAPVATVPELASVPAPTVKLPEPRVIPEGMTSVPPDTVTAPAAVAVMV